jgi:glutaredoxin
LTGRLRLSISILIESLSENPNVRPMFWFYFPKINHLALLLALLMGNGAFAAETHLPVSAVQESAGAVQAFVDLEVFVRSGCPHCDNAKKFLSALSAERPDIRISIRDVGQDPGALERLQQLSTAIGLKSRAIALKRS